MKRVKNLFEPLISDSNLELAIHDVNASHRWLPKHKPNKTVAWVEEDIPARVKDLREIIIGIIDGTVQLTPPLKKRRYDRSAGKWRDINEPLLWPDQYVHHALVQVLQPAMMKGMDRYCCGSIQKRGIHYGVKTIKKRMNRVLSENTCRSSEEVTDACERDNFMSAEEAKEFGLIDKILVNKEEKKDEA